MSFAHYLLQVNLYLIVFYCFYKLLLDKETYFTLNRVYLVAAGVLSLCIPFIRLEWLTEQRAAQQVYTTVNWNAVLQQATIVTQNEEGLKWGNVLVYIYCAGILFFLGRLIFNLFTVNKLIKNAGSGSAFSFFSKKIIDAELPQSDVINIHEEAHIKQWHTLDIIFFEIIGIITWLNPVIYSYKKAIKNIHEFLADEHAAEFQGDKAEYALLILSKSFGISPNTLTNGFFEKSLIKKRIYMLHKERSKKTAVMKYGIFIPLFAIFIVFSSATVRKNEKLILFAEKIPMEKPLALVQEMVTKPLEYTYTTKAKVSVKGIANSDWKDFYKFISKSIKYPVQAQENNFQGNSQVKFTLKNGRVNNVSTNIDLGNGCDEEVMKSILSYKGFKDIDNGNYALKVGFRLVGSESAVANEDIPTIKGYQNLSDVIVTAYKPQNENVEYPSSDEEDHKIYDFVSIDKQPEYPGGLTKFYDYMSKNIKYPSEAQDKNVQGKVFLSFIVEKDGELTDVQITRGLGSGTDEEAVRVMKNSPKWNPGIASGHPVRVKYNINVNFTLNNDGFAKTPEKTAFPITIRTKSNVQNKLILNGVESDDPKKAPLFILDGVTQSSEAVKNIRPDAIESISVLRDANATSIYGSKGANGVILITSKPIKGLSFRKPEIKELSIDKTSNHELLKKF